MAALNQLQKMAKELEDEYTKVSKSHEDKLRALRELLEDITEDVKPDEG